MPNLTAKAFRQQIFKPDEGVFLFHARAIERLIETQLGARLQGVSIPALPYYLMPRGEFLAGLETENPEALSVIEGLQLPPYVVLLSSPNTQRLDAAGFQRLRYAYWARRFEGEIAREWQTARDTRHDQTQFGVLALQRLIGCHAYDELCAVLAHDGVTLPVCDDTQICRAFVARIGRLRYFAPGARANFFPAIRTWPQVDAWLSASGLDFLPPLTSAALPALLLQTRPGGTDERWAMPIPLLPAALPYGRGDPDFHLALLHLAQQSASPPTAPAPSPSRLLPTDRTLTQRCVAALQQGMQVPRHRWPGSVLITQWSAQASRLINHLLFAPLLLRWHPPVTTPAPWQTAGLLLLRHTMAAAQRATWRNQFATALLHLATAKRLLHRLHGDALAPTNAGLVLVTTAAALNSHALAQLLAAKLKLDRHSAAELQALVERLVDSDHGSQPVRPARVLLLQLEQVLLDTRHDDYRLRPWHWLVNGGQVRLRQILPFQSPLRTLRALAVARTRLDELAWPLSELERFSVTLDTLTQRINNRLAAQLLPRLKQAMHDAAFIPRNHRERIAAHKMQHELFAVICARRHLKFTDVRDIVARNILRLPDPTMSEFFHGDQLRQFDRTAARALPGVYRPGELYILGLQQFAAPLFGTDGGRALLRHVLIPFGGAYLGLKSLDLLHHLLAAATPASPFANLMAIIGIGSAINLFLYTGIGWHVSAAMGRSLMALRTALHYMLFGEGLRQLLRWPPLATLLNTNFVRGLGRHVIAPSVIGILPLIPIMAIAVLVEEVPIRPGVWLLSLAFALGTLVRNTSTGRRFLDNFVTTTVWLLRRINQTLILGAIRQLLAIFKELTRRFAQILHRVDEALTHHLREHWTHFIIKMLLAPVWRLLEWLMQFYITVLIEPQVNPVKHFPIVTIGHKLLLPFLPAITTLFVTVTESVLPKWVAYPLVTLTIILLPGLFGFLVWELKENWRLYEANHVRQLQRHSADATPAVTIEPAIIGEHGETVRGILCRGLHSGTLPKGFDRLRRVLRDQLRDQAHYPKRLRAVTRRLLAIERALHTFVERELTFALQERCQQPHCGLRRVQTETLRLATHVIAIQLALYVRGQGHESAPVWLHFNLLLREGTIIMELRICGAVTFINADCWRFIGEDVRLFAERAQAQLVPIAVPPAIVAALQPIARRTVSARQRAL